MTNIKSVNFYDLCRICTTTTTNTGKIEIFSAEGKSKNMNGKLAECLSLNVEESDRLPKVVCQQCLQNLENFSEFRNLCRNSQMMLNSCLDSSQNGAKVVVKDTAGKCGNVLNSGNTSATLQPQQTLSLQQQQTPFQQPQTPVFTLQGSNLVAQAMPTTTNGTNQDFLNSIMQAVGIQPEKPAVPQYTITLDNSAQQNINQQLQQHMTNQANAAAEKEKELKNNALEEFLRLKPNIKVTPIGKKHQPQQQHQQQQQVQAQQEQIIQQQQIQQQQQQQQEQLVQLQLQQLHQQLQLLTSQLQPQQITISAPPSDNEDSSPSKNKKPKLNFVLTTPNNNNNTPAATLSTPIPQLTTSQLAAPQIQFQLQPSLGPQAILQTNQPNAAAATLLSNLAPLLQPQTQLNAAAALQAQSLANVAQNSSANILSPNKCYLPITIKDENTDQQFVAHIDAKNFILPTTYQLQMKLQPQITGQPIMQLAPTIQLAPNQTFPTAATVAALNNNSSAVSMNQAQALQLTPATPQVQQTPVSKPELSTPQQQSQTFKQPAPPATSKNIQITSQQIINPSVDIKKEDPSEENKTKSSSSSQDQGSRPAYKISQAQGVNAIEITPTTSFTQQIMQQVQQQQKQKLQQQQQQQQSNSATLTTQHGGITVQRITTKTSNQNAVPNTTNSETNEKHSKKSPTQNLPKLPILNKNNITISRVTTTTQNQSSQNQTQKSLMAANRNQVVKVTTNGPTTNTTLKVVTQPQPPKSHLQLTATKFVKKINSNTTGGSTPIAEQNPSTEQGPTNDATTSSTTATDSISTQQISVTSADLNTSGSGSASGSGNNIECSQCGRVFKKKEHLTQHLKLHTGIRPFKCNEEGCPKAFNRKEHLLRHLVSHSGKKMFSCDICQKPFSRKDNLSKHRKIHTETNGNNFVCEICNKTFVVKAYYIQHKLMHKTNTQQTEEDNKPDDIMDENNTNNNRESQNQNEQQNQQQQQSSTATQLATATISQQPQQTLHYVPQIMHMVTTQDMSGSTITIQATPSSSSSNNPNSTTLKGHDATVLNLPTSLANFVQLSQAQFVNASTGQIMGHLKIEK
ncbi:myb-like protein P [Musca vetustissima]|uniref:myb-like protein P n=1 Tax=Musca vetustissima TaxID=27455 RepID=UPI002AB7446C|nr:myb-like protein P [Musca vetustissima]